VPSLDAATAKTFSKINRPFKGIILNKVISGLIQLRKEFKGKIWLEIMLVAGINDSKKEAKKFKEIIDKINPDQVQINLPVRPAAVKISIPSQERINDIKKILGKKLKVVAKFSLKQRKKKIGGGLKRDILNFLKVRPASLEDLTISLGINSNQMIKQLYLLIEQGLIKETWVRKTKYFVTND